MKLTLINTGLSDSSYMVKGSCDNLKENLSDALGSKKQYMSSVVSGGFGLVYSCSAICSQSNDRVIFNTTVAALLFFHAIWRLPSGILGSSANALEEEQAEIQPRVGEEVDRTTAVQAITNRVLPSPEIISARIECPVSPGSEVFFEAESEDDNTILSKTNILWARVSGKGRKSRSNTSRQIRSERRPQIRALNKENMPAQIHEQAKKVATVQFSKQSITLDHSRRVRSRSFKWPDGSLNGSQIQTESNTTSQDNARSQLKRTQTARTEGQLRNLMNTGTRQLQPILQPRNRKVSSRGGKRRVNGVAWKSAYSATKNKKTKIKSPSRVVINGNYSNVW